MTTLTAFSTPSVDPNRLELVSLISANQLLTIGVRINDLHKRFFNEYNKRTAEILTKLDSSELHTNYWGQGLGKLMNVFTGDVQTPDTLLVINECFLQYASSSSHNFTQISLGTHKPLILADKVINIEKLDTESWRYWANVENISTKLTAEDRIELTAAFDIMIAILPEYYSWVVNVLNEIIPVQRPNKNTLVSASIRYRYGAIEIAFPSNKFEIIEMLIHECSHQYFNLSMTLGPLVKENSPEIFSPLKNTERPLILLLTGYHAFGNVLLAYNALKNNGFKSDILNREQKVLYYMKELTSGLENNKHYLTELGNSLYQTLSQKVNEIL
jgi:hypothetical protein